MNLVTGVTGLVGAHVALILLKQGKPVVALRRSKSEVNDVKTLFSFYEKNADALFEKIIWRKGDITDVTSLEEIMQGVDTVYHCAAFVSLNDKDEQELFKVNRDGTANMVNVSLAAGVKRFCHVSSVAAIQNAEANDPIDETVFWKSGSYQSAYAVSKYLAEQEVWRGIEEGLNAVIVNPGVIFGPGFWNRGSGKIFKQCLKGIRFYTEGRTGFVGAYDVANVMIRLTESGKFGERFLVIENNYSFKEVLEKIHYNLKKPLPSIRANKTLLNTARLFEKLVPGEAKFTRATIESVLDSKNYSNRKLMTNLSYNFESLNDCISFTCQALLQQKTIPD